VKLELINLKEKKLKKRLTFLIVMVLMVLGNISIAAKDEKTKKEVKSNNYRMVYFRGVPNSWELSKMNKIEDNKWEIKVTFNQGDSFKIDTRGDWSESYPRENYNVTKGNGNYKIIFNGENKSIELLKEKKDKIYSKYKSVYYTGTSNEWGKKEMELVSDGLWEIGVNINKGNSNNLEKFSIVINENFKDVQQKEEIKIEQGSWIIRFDEIKREVKIEKAEIIDFVSPEMEKYVRSEIGKLRGKLVKSDIENITSMSLQNIELKSLEDLVNFSSIETIDIRNNIVSNVDVLIKLKKLKDVKAEGNNFKEREYAVMEKLREAGVKVSYNKYVTFLNNKIDEKVRRELKKSSIETINESETGKITSLSFVNSMLDSIDDLKDLKDLKMLDFENNKITDIELLSKLPKLSYVNLKNNSIGLKSLNTIINLRKKGVKVEENIEYIKEIEDIKKISDLGIEYDIHTVGIIEGSNYNNGISYIDIDVERTDNPIILILSAKEKISWNIKLKEGVTLIGVVILDGDNHKVTGVKNYINFNKNMGLMKGCYIENYYEYLTLINKIGDIFGKNPLTVQAVYSGKSFKIDGSNKTEYLKDSEQQNIVEKVDKVKISEKTFYFLKDEKYGDNIVSEDERINKFMVANAGVNRGKWYGEFKLKTKRNSFNPGSWTSIGIVVNSDSDFWKSNNKILGKNIIDKWNQNVILNRELKNGDIIGMAIDLDNGKIYYSINGAWKRNPLNIKDGLDIPKYNLKYYMAISETSEGKAENSNDDSWIVGFDKYGMKYPIPMGYKPYGEIINIE
jgi:hypothetical protein